MPERQELEVRIPEQFKEPKEADTYRFRIEAAGLGIDFGRKTEDGAIDLIASINLSPDIVRNFLFILVGAMKQYEDEFHYSFGIFPKHNTNEASPVDATQEGE